MKAIITGMNGTVAPYVYDELRHQDIDVIIWDRTQTDIHLEAAVHAYISEHQPDLFFHIATGPIEWVEAIAKSTQALGIKLLFTSTVSVFSEKGSGPYTRENVPDSEEEYGKYKIECEKIIQKYHHNAIILRLGWQIGPHARPNNMFHYLTQQHQDKGYIEASSKWYPSCSFLEVSAHAIVDCALNFMPGVYLVNSNQRYSFFEIVTKLNQRYQMNWTIKETTSFKRDDRMMDSRVRVEDLF